jgi:hypothetical protein
VWKREGKKSIRITELPVGKGSPSYDDYKEFLESSLIENRPKANKKDVLSPSKRKEIAKNKDSYFIKEYMSSTNDVWCDYLITFPSKEALDRMIKNGELEAKLKLCVDIKISNMYMHDKDCQLKRYKNTSSIIKKFFEVRYGMYIKRKEYLLKQLQHQVDIISAKTRFLEMIISKKLNIMNTPRVQVIDELRKNEFPVFEPENDYKYLLKLPIIGVTKEKIEDYRSKCNDMMDKYNKLKDQTPQDLWKIDLDLLEDAIKEQNNQWEEDLKQSAELSAEMAKKRNDKKKRKRKK